jgi:hypothetical protein
MTRLSTAAPSYRLSDPWTACKRVDRELLVRRLGRRADGAAALAQRDVGLVLLGEKITGTEFTSEGRDAA